MYCFWKLQKFYLLEIYKVKTKVSLGMLPIYGNKIHFKSLNYQKKGRSLMNSI